MTTLTAPRVAQSPSSGIGLGLKVVLLGQLMLILDATIVNVALPHIATDLHFSHAGLSWVLSAYALAFGGLLLLGGRIGDVYGRRRTFLFGLSLFTLASLTAGLAPTPTSLVISRGLQGVGAALAAPNVLALITTGARDDRERTRALALFSAVASTGGALGLILGGLLTDTGTWRWTMFVNVPIGIVVTIAVARLVTETPRQPGRFDLVGAFTATGGAIALVWALIEAPEHGWLGPRTVTAAVVGVGLLVALVITERRVASPLLQPTLLRSPRRVSALIAMATNYANMMATFFLVVQYLEDYLGHSPLFTGIVFLPFPVSIFLASRILPWLIERVSATTLVIIGAVLRLGALIPLTQLSPSTPFAEVVAVLVLAGVSTAAVYMPLTKVALEDVPAAYAGAASGLFQTTQQMGGAVGLAIIASTFAAFVVPGDFLAGATAGFWAATVLAVVSLLASVTLALRPETSRRS